MYIANAPILINFIPQLETQTINTMPLKITDKNKNSNIISILLIRNIKRK